jgi:hypothetical protein
MSGSAMTDAEIRGRLLKHFYGLRNSNDGWVPTSEIILSPEQVSRQVIANVCQQLAEAGYIQWHPFNPPIEQLAIGRAKITGPGVDVVTGAHVPTLDIRLPDMPVLAPKEAESKSSEPEHPPEAARAGPNSREKPIQPTTARESPQKSAELITLKPTFMGMSVDLKELWRRFSAWRERPR